MANGSSQGELSRFERHTYEDPFLDMASTRLPKSMRKLQELCQIFATTHPQISPIVWRLSEYPVTSFVYDGSDEVQRQNREMMEDELEMIDRCIEFGLDYNAFGSCFVTVGFPFLRFYQCLGCKEQISAKDLKYRYDGREFSGTCMHCKGQSKFEPMDQYLRGTKRGVRVFRLEPQLVTPKYNRVTGKTRYFYSVPNDIKMAVRAGDRDIIDETPVEYLKAVRFNRMMKLSRVFQFKRPTVSGRDMQWGLPVVLPALKDAYLNQIYKKADEQVALEHSVPLRILYPEPGSQDPLHKLLLGSFRNFMERNVRYWRRDKNAILTSPVPVGVRVIGGDGANYSTIAARTKVIDEIMMAMGVTPGFVRGGENWSSMSISQRVMENSFSNYLRRLDKCIQWVRDEVSTFVDLPACTVTMKPFKKIDDVQTLQLLVSLAQMDKVSWHEVLSRLDLDEGKELKQINETLHKHVKIMVEKLIGQAEATGKQALIDATNQIEAQGAQESLQAMIGQPQAEGGGEGGSEGEGEGGPKMDDTINQYAQELIGMDDGQKRQVLQRMNASNPDLAKAVVQRASELQGGNTAGEIVSNAKNPEEAAQKISMLPGREQLTVLKAVQRTNPTLFVRVMQHLAAMNAQQAGMVGPGGGKSVVDMRPLPEKLPPRRKEPTI